MVIDGRGRVRLQMYPGKAHPGRPSYAPRTCRMAVPNQPCVTATGFDVCKSGIDICAVLGKLRPIREPIWMRRRLQGYSKCEQAREQSQQAREQASKRASKAIKRASGAGRVCNANGAAVGSEGGLSVVWGLRTSPEAQCELCIGLSKSPRRRHTPIRRYEST